MGGTGVLPSPSSDHSGVEPTLGGEPTSWPRMPCSLGNLRELQKPGYSAALTRAAETEAVTRAIEAEAALTSPKRRRLSSGRRTPHPSSLFTSDEDSRSTTPSSRRPRHTRAEAGA